MITAIILVHNQERVLSRAIGSVQFCDEVLVIDDKSTDTSVEVAKKLGARVIERPLNNDFAAQRNFGLKQAKHEWVLFIDADEEVSETLRKEIVSTLEKNPSENGYYLRRNDIFLGKPLYHGETAHAHFLRLGRKNKGKWARPVHEFWQIEGPTGSLSQPILHHPHASIQSFIDKINYYTEIEAKYRSDQGKTTSVVEMIVWPLGKFLDNFFLKAGVFDGYRGLIMAVMMSLHSLIVRVKLYEQNTHQTLSS